MPSRSCRFLAGMSTSTVAQLLSNPLTAVILTSDVLDVRPA